MFFLLLLIDNGPENRTFYLLISPGFGKITQLSNDQQKKEK